MLLDSNSKVGYKATRVYWSCNTYFKRCRYVCSIVEHDSRPQFTVQVTEENGDGGDANTNSDMLLAKTELVDVDDTPTAIWHRLLGKLAEHRRANGLINIFAEYMSGEYMFGLCEPHIIRLVESLPGIETLNNYAFKYGKMQLLDMPLTLNPSGCARTEPNVRTHFRSKASSAASSARALTATTATPATAADSNACAQQQQQSVAATVANLPTTSSTSVGSAASGSGSGSYAESASTSDEDESGMGGGGGDDGVDETNPISYVKQFTLSKSTQVKKLRTEWRSNVYLAKSRIQGLGLYAARDLEKNSMIIEYIGELIRNEVANRREKLYEEKNRGIYMFRLSDDHVVDATISGGLARYINHCCDPNCIAETISTTERDQKIIIIANKRILKGEEVTHHHFLFLRTNFNLFFYLFFFLSSSHTITSLTSRTRATRYRACAARPIARNG